jgi:hypothetical protein
MIRVVSIVTRRATDTCEGDLWPAGGSSSGQVAPLSHAAQVRAIQKHRHSVVNRPREGVGVRDDHGAGQHGFVSAGAVPPVPQTRDAEHATIGGADEIRLLPSGMVFDSK